MKRLALLALIACATPPPPPPPLPAAEAPRPPPGPDRSQFPAPEAPRPYTPPTPAVLRLKSGLAVLLIERHELPLFTAQLIVRGGIGAEPDKVPGLATFFASMLDEGTRSYDAAGLSERAESLGATVWSSADFEATYVGVSGLAENMDPTLALLAEVALAPTFPDKDLERVRGERLAAMLQEVDQPGTLAALTGRRLLFGAHPMGRRALGTVEGNKAVQRKQLVARYAELFRPSNATLVVVGDARSDDLVPRLEKALGGWKEPKGKAPTFAVAKVARPAAPAIALVDRPASAQSVVAVGFPAMHALHPDAYAGEVLNAIFGGMFSSRLNMNLREAHGYSYGANSSIGAQRDNGLWWLQTGVKAEHTADALSEILGELHRIAAEPPSAQEMDLARNYLIRVQPLRMETNGGIAGGYSTVVAVGLPLDTFATYAERIRAVTAEDVLRVARALLEAPPSITVVGDAKAHRSALEALSAAPVASWGTDLAPLGK